MLRKFNVIRYFKLKVLGWKGGWGGGGEGRGEKASRKYTLRTTVALAKTYKRLIKQSVVSDNFCSPINFAL